MRATVRTTLALGDLLEIPIGVASATTHDDPKLDTAGPDGAKRVTQYVHPGKSRTLYAVPHDEALDAYVDPAAGTVSTEVLTPVEVPEVITESIKGVRVGKDFRVVPPSEVQYATAATTLDRVELLEVIDYRKVPTDRLGGAHWIQPDPGFARPLAVLMAALKRDGNAMLVKWSARSRQRLAVIRVRKTDKGDALILNDVTFAAQWRQPDEQVLEPGTLTDLDERAVASACEILRDHHGTGKALDTAEDALPALHIEIVERAHDGLYDDPARVLALVQHYRDEFQGERADRLVAWAEERWPVIAEQRDEVERVLAAENGEPTLLDSLVELVGA